MGTGIEDNLAAVGLPIGGPRSTQFFVEGVSPAMQGVKRAIADLARTDIPVVIVGESGTGKELVALEIHRLSLHANEPFVKWGCSGLTAQTLATRLEGSGKKPGRGMGGSLFLDEISQLDAASQSRLLDVLPGGSAMPSENSFSMRIISSTTRNLEEERRSGRFRDELYYRISGMFLRLPALRERSEDIPALLDFFIKKYASLFGRPEPRLGTDTMDLMLRYSWPGNIRELENVARKVVALGNEQFALNDVAVSASKDILATAAVPAIDAPLPRRSLKEAARQAARKAEKEMILVELERTHWNRKRTARDLQISYKALLYKLKQLGLDDQKRVEPQ